jgi:hypothetical protein
VGQRLSTQEAVMSDSEVLDSDGRTSRDRTASIRVRCAEKDRQCCQNCECRGDENRKTHAEWLVLADRAIKLGRLNVNAIWRLHELFGREAGEFDLGGES